jgi:drug/metabolite transporter (DMT)-like permease
MRTVCSCRYHSRGRSTRFPRLPLAQVYAILFAAPLLITILAIPLLGERVGIQAGFGRAGWTWRGHRGPAAHDHDDHSWPYRGACGGGRQGRFASVIVRKIGREERAVVLILYPMMANFVLMGAAMPFVYEPMPGQDLALLAVIAALALIATNCLIFAYRAAPAATVAPMQYSQIIWASAYGALFFGEALEWATLLGTVIIVASGLYIVFREDRGGRSHDDTRAAHTFTHGVSVSPARGALPR